MVLNLESWLRRGHQVKARLEAQDSAASAGHGGFPNRLLHPDIDVESCESTQQKTDSPGDRFSALETTVVVVVPKVISPNAQGEPPWKSWHSAKARSAFSSGMILFVSLRFVYQTLHTSISHSWLCRLSLNGFMLKPSMA